MVDRESDERNRRAFSARISVEAIVVVLVVSATIGIFTVKTMTGRWEDAPSASGKVAGLRHDAISAASLSDSTFPESSQSARRLSGEPRDSRTGAPPASDDGVEPGINPAPAAADQDKSSPSSDTVVRNGITVVSPPLLVPVIEAGAIQTTNGSENLTSPHKASTARRRSHYANRIHTRAQRRVVRSAPFWRIVAR